MKRYRCIAHDPYCGWALVGDVAKEMVGGGYRIMTPQDTPRGNHEGHGHHLGNRLSFPWNYSGWYFNPEEQLSSWQLVQEEVKFKVGDTIEIVAIGGSLSDGYATFGGQMRIGMIGTVESIATRGLTLKFYIDGMPTYQHSINPKQVKLARATPKVSYGIPSSPTYPKTMSAQEKLEGLRLAEEVKEKSLDEMLAEAEKVDPTPTKLSWKGYMATVHFSEDWRTAKVRPVDIEEEEEGEAFDWEEEDEEDEEVEDMSTSIDDLVRQAEAREGAVSAYTKPFKAKLEVKSVKKSAAGYAVEMEREEEPRGFMKEENRVTPNYKPRRVRGLGFKPKSIL